jgi:hypothetical protein
MTYMIEVYCKKDQVEPPYVHSFREENEHNICYTYEFKTIKSATNAGDWLRELGYYIEGPSPYGDNEEDNTC